MGILSNLTNVWIFTSDSRANTLLGGNIPTSVNGIINKVIDFGVEKAGVGKKLQDMQRAGAIEKAKDLTTP